MSFKYALRNCLLMDLNIPAPEEDLDEPFLLLGFGINAYFDILQSLSYMFLMISLFAIPVFLIYSSGSHYSGR